MPINMPPTTTMARGFCTWLPTPWAMEAGKSPREAISPPIKTGRNLSRVVSRVAFSLFFFLPVDFYVMSNPDAGIENGNPYDGYKSDDRGYAERLFGQKQADEPAKYRANGGNGGQEYISHIPVKYIKKDEDEENGQGDGDVKSPESLLHLIEDAAPFQIIAFGEFDLGRFLLGLRYGPAQILGNYAEFYGNVPVCGFPGR